MEIPEDVRAFIEEARERGFDVRKVAIAKVPFSCYYYFEDGKYVGEVGEEISREENIVMCHDDLCLLFHNDEPVLVMERSKGKIYDVREL